MGLSEKEKFLGHAQGAGGGVFLDVPEMFKGGRDPVDGGLGEFEQCGEFTLGGAVGAGRKFLKKGQTSLERGSMRGSECFHGRMHFL